MGEDLRVGGRVCGGAEPVGRVVGGAVGPNARCAAGSRCCLSSTCLPSMANSAPSTAQMVGEVVAGHLHEEAAVALATGDDDSDHVDGDGNHRTNDAASVRSACALRATSEAMRKHRLHPRPPRGPSRDETLGASRTTAPSWLMIGRQPPRLDARSVQDAVACSAIRATTAGGHLGVACRRPANSQGAGPASVAADDDDGCRNARSSRSSIRAT